MEIVPGIHIIDGSIGCNTYLVLDDGVTLVDTGLRGNIPRIYNYLDHVGHRPRDISRIVITHAHLDHINCLYQLRQDSGAVVMAGARDADIIEGRRPLRAGTGLFGGILRAVQAYYRYRPVRVDARLEDGDAIAGMPGFRAVSLPGHSEGNMGLYSRDRRTFFSSDSVRVSGDRPVRPSARFTQDMDTAVASIGKIGELDFDVMLPGHGHAITSAASEKVRELYGEIGQRVPGRGAMAGDKR